MGYVGDWLGRSKAMALTMSLTVLGALFSSFNLQDIFGVVSNPYGYMTFCRLILGVGVGGVYPLAATVAAESTVDATRRGREVSAVFSTQGLGFIMAPLMVLILTYINPGTDHCKTPYCQMGKFKNSTDCLAGHFTDGCDAVTCNALSQGCNDLNWRLCLLIGALPGILIMPFKVRVPSCRCVSVPSAAICFNAASTLLQCRLNAA